MKNGTRTIYSVYIGYYGATPQLVRTYSSLTEAKNYIKGIKKPYVESKIVASIVLDYSIVE